MSTIERSFLASGSRPEVVLVDPRGRIAGRAEKSGIHTSSTPLHLGFSCYAFRPDGKLLLTRRASHKPTWPGVWTNSCCGHPAPGETLYAAVRRHMKDELGIEPRGVTLALGDFAYRAAMTNGIVEHELCPVVFAMVNGEPAPNPLEVDEWAWIDWDALVVRGSALPESLSPWCVEQLEALVAARIAPAQAFAGGDAADALLQRVPGADSSEATDVIDALGSCRQRVEAHLDDFARARRADVPGADDAIAVLATAIDMLTESGGKRLRPAFVLWGHVACGGDLDDVPPLHAAAAVELLHAFALLHDDVMDRSVVRRGRPTAQHSLAAHHRGAEADRAWFGISAAVLAGDLAFVWADRMFDRLFDHDVDPRRLRTARELFTMLRTEVIAGQLLDLRTGCSPSASEGDAARIALLKSARYTVTRPLQLGAALAGADARTMDELAVYGDATGTAFQLRDDILGVFGDTAATGKSNADDLREGKRTLLILRALRLTTDAGRAALTGALGDNGLDDETIGRCREVISSSGALASVEMAIDVHLERAVGAAARFDSRAAEALVSLARQAARRDR